VAIACPDKTVCKGRSAQLVVNGGVQWQWSPATGLSNPNSDIPVATPDVTTVYTVIVTDKEGCTATEEVTVFVNDCRKAQEIIATEEDFLTLKAKVFLQGARVKNEFLMHDLLREKELIPLKEPYSTLKAIDEHPPLFKHIRGGNERINPDILHTTGEDAIVDWVLVELRWEYDPSKILATRSVLIQRDGDIVDIDGISPVRFYVPQDRYFVAVRHRNHLGAMSEKALSFFTKATIDFTDIEQTFYTLQDADRTTQFPMKPIGGFNYLWGGNANGDNKIIYQGPGLDKEKIIFDIAFHPNNPDVNYNFIYEGYQLGDSNMDGNMIYQGLNNDVDELQFFNVILHEENERALPNKIIFEQLPR